MGAEKKEAGKESVFDRIVRELMQETDSADLLEMCSGFDPKLARKVPLRVRIIALGFRRRWTLEELDAHLTENGCAQLYSRSLTEASLIYAFLHHLSYEEWRRIYAEARKSAEGRGDGERYFRENTVTLREIRRYLEDNSGDDDSRMTTKHLTRSVERQIGNLREESFVDFLTENINSFSDVREKSRYYFCKYLYFYIKSRIDDYVRALRTGNGTEGAVENLTVLKGLTGLRRRKMAPEEARNYLEGCSVSCGGIFDAFNAYYFGYVSADWMEVLLDYYGNISRLGEDERRALASALRKYYPKEASLTDDEVLKREEERAEAEEKRLDEAYGLESPGKGYQKNRTGENTIRKYIKGVLDIDRTTLVCFLLFFGSRSHLPKELRIDRARISEILSECGFPPLRDTDEFDYFVIKYLEADDPTDYLMEEVTDYAIAGENFFLYRMYRASESYSGEFRQLTDV